MDGDTLGCGHLGTARGGALAGEEPRKVWEPPEDPEKQGGCEPDRGPSISRRGPKAADAVDLVIPLKGIYCQGMIIN